MTRTTRLGLTGLPAGLLVLALAGQATAVAAPEAPWAPASRQVDAALARKEYTLALRSANEAYGLALGSERWDGMISVGDLYRRIGEATGLRVSFNTKAREAYQTALFRARQQASIEGVLRAVEGYAALGDGKMVTLGLRVADRLAVGNPEAQADVRSFRVRLGDSRPTAAEVGR